MTGSDDEFADFLRRRRRFSPPADDGLEPPPELDRLVLRHAREAIEGDRPQRVFHAPRWGMPVALAATLVLAFTIILRVSAPAPTRVAADVTVQNVARQVEPAATAAPVEAPAMVAQSATADEAPAADGAIVADIATSPARESDERTVEARRAAAPTDAQTRSYAAAPPAAPALASPAASQTRVDSMSAEHKSADTATSAGARLETASAPLAKARADAPAFRHDEKSWLAEIERLRAAGDVARADAELAEYKRQHRAYAGSPDR